MNLTSRTARRLAVGTALACASLLVPAAIALAAPATSARPAAPAKPATPACETPGLVEWMDTQGSGAAGSVFYTLEFTNLSGHACTLNGFPYLYAVGLSGHQIGHIATFNHTPPPHQITIGNGKTATAQLQIVDVGNFPTSACHPVTAAGLKIFPPNQTRSKTVPFPFRACSSGSPVFLTVGAVR